MENSGKPPLPPRVPPVVQGTPPLWNPPNTQSTPPPPPQKNSGLAKWLSSLGIIGTLLLTVGGKLKFLLPVLKFIGPALKTGGTMLLSIWVYAMAYNWKFAVGFVLLIFIHEMGHVFAARQAGIAVTAPTFIPFIGAHILIKQSMPGAWVEAKIGYGGPLAGAWASALCHWIWLETGEPFWAALAYTGYFLNLFNMAPVSPLDGGRITAAISPWLWVIGYVLLGTWLGLEIYRVTTEGTQPGPGTFLMGMILLMGLPRLLSLFRTKSEEERRYYTVTPRQRLGMSLAYFGLIAALGYGMTLTHITTEALR